MTADHRVCRTHSGHRCDRLEERGSDTGWCADDQVGGDALDRLVGRLGGDGALAEELHRAERDCESQRNNRRREPSRIGFGVGGSENFGRRPTAAQRTADHLDDAAHQQGAEQRDREDQQQCARTGSSGRHAAGQESREDAGAEAGGAEDQPGDDASAAQFRRAAFGFAKRFDGVELRRSSCRDRRCRAGSEYADQESCDRRKRAVGQREIGGHDPGVGELCAQHSGEQVSGHRAESCRRSSNEQHFTSDHDVHLPRGGPDCPQQSELSAPGVDRERQRAGNDEHTDHQRETGKRRAEHDQLRPRSTGVEEFDASACSAGRDLRTGSGECIAGESGSIHAFGSDQSDCGDSVLVRPQPFGLCVVEEDECRTVG